MPTCPGCGASYASDFRFCPHCGRSAPQPEVMLVQRVDNPSDYEEATLRLRFTIEHQVLYTTKGFFGTSAPKAYIQLGYIDLMALSHTKGEYVALTSERVRGIQHTPDGYHLPHSEAVADGIWKRTYESVEAGVQSGIDPTDPRKAFLGSIIRERSTSWQNFCASLVGAGWMGTTDDAVRRTNPWAKERRYELYFGNGLPSNSEIYHWYGEYRKKNPDKVFYLSFDTKAYRYRRRVV